MMTVVELVETTIKNPTGVTLYKLADQEKCHDKAEDQGDA